MRKPQYTQKGTQLGKNQGSSDRHLHVAGAGCKVGYVRIVIYETCIRCWPALYFFYFFRRAVRVAFCGNSKRVPVRRCEIFLAEPERALSEMRQQLSAESDLTSQFSHYTYHMYSDLGLLHVVDRGAQTQK